MGIDCRLLIVDGDYGDWGYSHSVVELHRNYAMYDRIQAAIPIELPKFKLNTWAGTVIPDGKFQGELAYGEICKTPYGQPVTYLKASELSQAMLAGELSEWNAAAAKWLGDLGDRWVGLYWH